MMTSQIPVTDCSEFQRLRQFTARVGRDPMLTQGSTGNSSLKLGDELWIKSSGRWMRTALLEDIFVRLDLRRLRACLRSGTDPAAFFPEASLETPMHALIPQSAVIHVHSVEGIAWAVRADGFRYLEERLNGIRWQWVPYLASGLPLARGIEDALNRQPDTELFVLANHGLVVAAPGICALEELLNNVQERLRIPRRVSHPADYSMLTEISACSAWDIPDDDDIHALATDALARRIISGGILYPCQIFFSGHGGFHDFQPVSCGSRFISVLDSSDRPFLILEGYGVLVSRTIGPAALAMLSGLAQVVQRISADTPLRYLPGPEIAELSGNISDHYRELANRLHSDARQTSRSAAG